MAKTLAEGRKAGSGRKAGATSFCAVDLESVNALGVKQILVSRIWAQKNGLIVNSIPASEAHQPAPEITIIDFTT